MKQLANWPSHVFHLFFFHSIKSNQTWRDRVWFFSQLLKTRIITIKIIIIIKRHRMLERPERLSDDWNWSRFNPVKSREWDFKSTQPKWFECDSLLKFKINIFRKPVNWLIDRFNSSVRAAKLNFQANKKNGMYKQFGKEFPMNIQQTSNTTTP